MASLEVLLEKVERRREEMVDLQRVDWRREGICGFGSVSEMRWLNWFLGLLHLMCSDDTAEASVTADMAWRKRGRSEEGEFRDETNSEGGECVSEFRREYMATK